LKERMSKGLLCSAHLKLAKINFYEKKFSSVASNQKLVWKLVNDLKGRTSKNKDSVDSININNHILNIEENTKEASNQFNNFFVNVGKKLSENFNYVPKIDFELTNNRTYCLYSFDEMFHK
ncbi:hypothetical protein ACI65C_009427, partial [Semiaphis heraclei]